MDSTTREKIEILRLYLSNLPDNLPLPPPHQSAYQFGSFAPDLEWLEEIGEEGAVNRQLEIILGLRARGPIILKERGPGILALADVFETYLGRYPESEILRKWLSDMIGFATLSYETAQVKVSKQNKQLKREDHSMMINVISFLSAEPISTPFSELHP
jgi:hypothetical protein